MSLASVEARLKRVGIDRYMMCLISTVIIAALLPARGAFAEVLSHVTFWAVALLFFIYGAKQSTASILAGLANWRLQLGCLLATFVMFPILGLIAAPLASAFLPAAFGIGLLYIGCMPSTVQSSIAFTSVSGGNVSGAVCAASISNILGVLLSPFLFGLLIPSDTGMTVGLDAVWKIVQQILIPFILGQIARKWIGAWVQSHKTATMLVDRGSILLIVYSAFSAGMVKGVFSTLGLSSFAIVVGIVVAMVVMEMILILLASKATGMSWEDRLAFFYVGSTKSLATGLPMAGVLFAGQDIALIIMPLMLFHLIQLFVCAVISQQIAAKKAAA